MGLINNRKIIFLIVLGAAVFIFAKIAPLFKTDTEKIRHIIYSAKSATEKEEIFKCISYVSMDYKDKDDNDRPSLFLIAKNVFQNYDGIYIIIENLKINIVNNALAIARVWSSGQGRRQSEGGIPDIEKVEFEITFRKEGNSWKVVELKFIHPEDFLHLLKGL